MMTDPIADMLTRIRNALMARHRQVLVPSSRMKVAIARIMKQEGFVRHFDVNNQAPQPMLRVILKYDDKREPVMHGLKRVSKPGRRIYTDRQEIPRVQSGMGVAVISTSKGVVTDREARRMGIGGEVVCYIW
jgi:small subunit ribosomal protein S8